MVHTGTCYQLYVLQSKIEKRQETLCVGCKKENKFCYFCELFCEEIENFFLVFIDLRKPLGKFGRTLSGGNTPIVPNFHSCLYNFIKTGKMFSISQIHIHILTNI